MAFSSKPRGKPTTFSSGMDRAAQVATSPKDWFLFDLPNIPTTLLSVSCRPTSWLEKS